jgi:5,6-dimethylbenzimidazole synthase
MNLYETIYSRRDVREFLCEDVPDTVLIRILDAAHHAGSVGFMQPWNFLVIRSPETREHIGNIFLQENVRAAQNYSGAKRTIYDSITSNPVRDAPINIAVTCDRQRCGPHVLGRQTMPETDLYSTCCAIQNLWLAARAEGLGMCWMSIIDPEAVKQYLGIPERIVLVGYLCLGYPVQFDKQPLLEQVGWQSRRSLDEVLFSEGWQQPWDRPECMPAPSPDDSGTSEEHAWRQKH